MRGWQIVCLMVVVTAAGHSGTHAAQILRYTESRHSRSEEGVPGSNVTGGWSWVDHHGQRRHVWYVADTGGFRAFGDITPQGDSAPLHIGVPVVVAILPAPPPSRPQLKGSSATQSTLTLDPAQGGSQQQDSTGTRIESVTIQAEHEKITPVTDTNLQKNFEASLQDGIIENPNATTSVGQEKETITATTATTTTTSPAKTASTKTQDSITETPIPCATHPPRTSPNGEPLTPTDDTKHGLPKSLSPAESNFQKDKSTDHLPIASFLTAKQSPITPSDNNFVASVFDKLSTVLGAPADNMQKPLLHSQQENEVVSVSSTPEIALSPPSDFVLINRLRAPTIPKPRVGTQRLVPKPVSVVGRTAPVVMGLHSSGKPSTVTPQTHAASDLEPLGIHLLNLVPTPQKTVTANRPVPRPARVVGEPNLDTFWSPAREARRTSPPFKQSRPSEDYDYLYYDYYDYTDTGGENTGGPVGSPSHKMKTKTVRSNSEEYSLETDYSGSEESEDSSDSQ
ncbi:mucin-2-like isoform X1 [Eriocheir sinensis]|uniref:mucin-2-like isoform X1 n=2 Tax=Eriocheir sinensis TaxID=95602 RepID=UPI0021C7F638|nr:mucin-2-like isoform X1 [Eriocheir sinensis]